MNESKECWVCLSEEPESDIIHPCPCSGTCGSIHRECLKAWIKNSGRLQCANCRTPYVFAQESMDGWSMFLCALVAIGESVLALVLVHIPIFILFPSVYAANADAANEETRMVVTLLVCYGLELVFLTIIGLCMVAIPRDVHEWTCRCPSCRYGSTSLVIDFCRILGRTTIPVGAPSSAKGSGGGSVKGGGGKGDGVPVILLILLGIVLIVFYAGCLAMIGYLVYRQVCVFYAKRKINACQIISIR